jgi:hypothetical protein
MSLLSGDFSSIQMKRSFWPTWSLMLSKAMAWVVESWKSRQSMMSSGGDAGKCRNFRGFHANYT